MTRRFTVRHAEISDTQRIFDFYAAHENDFVFQRDPDLWRARIADGAVTMVEDDTGKIVGAMMSYPVMEPDGAGGTRFRWSEIGSANVAERGIGIFDVLFAAHVLRSVMMEPPEEGFIVEIVAGNAHSKHVFLRQGARHFDIPPDTEKSVTSTISPADRAKKREWYVLDATALPAIAARYLAMTGHPVMTDKKTGAQYAIDFSRCAVAQHCMPALRKMAGMVNNKPAPPVRKFRDGLKP